jgi:hypothetical protein
MVKAPGRHKESSQRFEKLSIKKIEASLKFLKMKDKGQYNNHYSFECSVCGNKNYIEAEPYPGVKMLHVCSTCNNICRLVLSDTNKRSKLQEPILILINAVHDVFTNIAEPMTARGVFYQLTTIGAIEKSEKGYDQVCRILGQMRWRGWLDWRLIVDESRFFMKPETYSDPKDALDHWSISYRRALWDNKDVTVQIYVEKLALAGIMRSITDMYDVPLFPMRGFNSLSYSKDIARQIIKSEKHTVLYHFGDYDPSGVAAATTLQDTLYNMGARNFTFERVALHPWQVKAWSLPTRPTKTTDTRAKGFEGESCELDAIPPAMLRAMVESCINNHITPGEVERIKAIEAEERSILRQLNLAG